MKLTKILSALLVLLMLASLAAGCTNGGGKDPADSTTVADTEETAALPTVRYDGYAFNVLESGLSVNEFNDFSIENAEGYSTVNEAIFKRNSAIEETYGIKITYEQDFGLSWGNGPGFQHVLTDYMANEASYDLCAVGTFDAPQLAINGYLYDLNILPYLNLSASWWDKEANRDLCVAGKMYYTTGDISLNDNITTHCILFNKEIAAQKNITDIYDLVGKGLWTFDKFAEYTRSVSGDLDGNGVMDKNDLYGVLSWNDCLQATLAGAKSKIAGVNAEGKIELSLYSDKNAALLDKLTTLIFDTNVSYNYVNRTTDGRWQDKMIEIFSNNQALFYTTMLSTVPSLRNSTVNFGILPYPKYDLTQSDYGSYVPSTYSQMYCVEANIEDEERTGVLIEAIAFESQKTVTPAYYNQTLIGRYVRDDESVTCLDIIFSTRTFDLGIYYKIGDYTGQLTNIMKNGNNNFVSMYESHREAAEAQIEELNFQFAGD